LIIAKYSVLGADVRVDHEPGGVRSSIWKESDRVEDGWKWLTLLLPFFSSTPQGQQESFFLNKKRPAGIVIVIRMDWDGIKIKISGVQ